MNNLGISKLKLSAILCLIACLNSPAYASEAGAIKWMRTCAGGDWSHAKWVVGLADGAIVWSHFNPNQGRASMYTLALSAFMAGQYVIFENASTNTSKVCGVNATHFVDLAPGSSSKLTLAKPPLVLNPKP